MTTTLTSICPATGGDHVPTDDAGEITARYGVSVYCDECHATLDPPDPDTPTRPGRAWSSDDAPEAREDVCDVCDATGHTVRSCTVYDPSEPF